MRKWTMFSSAALWIVSVTLASDPPTAPFSDDFNDAKWDDTVWKRSDEHTVSKEGGQLIVNGSGATQWAQSRKTFGPGADGVRLEVLEIHRGQNSFIGFSDRGGADATDGTRSITFRSDQDKEWWIQVGDDIWESSGVAQPPFNSDKPVRFRIDWNSKSVTMSIDVGDDGKLEFQKTYKIAMTEPLPIYFRNQPQQSVLAIDDVKLTLGTSGTPAH